MRDPIIEARVRTMLDRAANDDERMDAVMEFSNEYAPAPNQPAWMFDERVRDALAELASRSGDGFLCGEAAETLALTWIYSARFDSRDRERLERLTDDAQREVRAYFEVNDRAEWLD